MLDRKTDDVSIETFYENKCWRDPGTWGGMSKLYSLFSGPINKLSFQTAWEGDPGGSNRDKVDPVNDSGAQGN